MDSLKSWFEHLTGEWLLTREISSGEAFEGLATFAIHAENRLLLAEKGLLTLAGGKSVQASRQWYWSLRGNKLLIEFAERPPRPYHQIDLARVDGGWHGKADHLCVDDTYDGEYLVGINAMKISQKVKGPNKDYGIVSRFTRNHSK